MSLGKIFLVVAVLILLTLSAAPSIAEFGYFDVYSVDDLNYLLPDEIDRLHDQSAKLRVEAFLGQLRDIEADLSVTLKHLQDPQRSDSDRQTTLPRNSRLRYLLLRQNGSGVKRGYGVFIQNLDETLDGEPAFAEISSLKESHDEYLRREMPWIWRNCLESIAPKTGIAFKGAAIARLRGTLDPGDFDALHAGIEEDNLQGAVLGFLHVADKESFLILAGRGEGRYGVGTVQFSRTGFWHRLKNDQASREWESFGQRLGALLSNEIFQAKFSVSLQTLKIEQSPDPSVIPDVSFTIHHDRIECSLLEAPLNSQPQSELVGSRSMAVPRDCLMTGYAMEFESDSDEFEYLWRGEVLTPGDHIPLSPKLSYSLTTGSNEVPNIHFSLQILAVPSGQLKAERDDCLAEKDRLDDELGECRTEERQGQIDLKKALHDAETSSRQKTSLFNALRSLNFDLEIPDGLDFERMTLILEDVLSRERISSNIERRKVLLDLRSAWPHWSRQTQRDRQWAIGLDKKDWRRLNERLLDLWNVLADRCSQLQLIRQDTTATGSLAAGIALRFEPDHQHSHLRRYIKSFLNHDPRLACRVPNVRQISPVRADEIAVLLRTR